MTGFTFGEAGLIGAGNQKCGLNFGEAYVHRSREGNADSTTLAAAAGCSAFIGVSGIVQYWRTFNCWPIKIRSPDS